MPCRDIHFTATLFNNPLFLTHFRKIAKRDYKLPHVCLSVCPPTNNWAPAGWTVVKFYSWWFFENLYRKFEHNQNITGTTGRLAGTLHDNPRTFVAICRLCLLKLRNVSENSCGENQNTHFWPITSLRKRFQRQACVVVYRQQTKSVLWCTGKRDRSVLCSKPSSCKTPIALVTNAYVI